MITREQVSQVVIDCGLYHNDDIVWSEGRAGVLSIDFETVCKRIAAIAVAEYKQDAERYRFLRDDSNSVDCIDRSEDDGSPYLLSGDILDSAIDDAICARSQPK